jgi:hypothetical protein
LGGRRLEAWSPVVALTAARTPRHVIANEVPRGRPGRDAVEAVVRKTLLGLDSRWRARIAPVEACCVELASPDGFSCLAFVPNPGGQETRALLAQRLRDACLRPPRARADAVEEGVDPRRRGTVTSFDRGRSEGRQPSRHTPVAKPEP